MMNCGIYKIVAPSGNFYAGSAVDMERRKGSHFRSLRKGEHHSWKLQRAWNKYGERLSFEPMIVCSKRDLFLYEQLVLDKLKPRYNVAKAAGAAMLGVRHTDAARKKIAAASKKLWADNPDHRAKMSAMTIALNKRRKFTPETRKKMSDTGKKRFENNPALREARSKSGRAQRHTKEAKAKIGAASAADWASNPAKRKKWSEDTAARNRAKIWTVEDRAAMAATKNARYASDPALREKIANSVRGFKHTPEAIAKIAAASRNRSPETIAKRSKSLKAAWARRKSTKSSEELYPPGFKNEESKT